MLFKYPELMKSKVVLFNPKPSSRYYYKDLPLSLLSISSIINKDFDIKIFQALPSNNYKENILKETKDALCFAVSCMTGYQIKEALEIIKLVKQQNPDIPIIVGGPHPTILPEQTLKNKYIDIICIGRGEETFAEIVKSLKNKEYLKNIKGIGYKDKGKIIFTPSRPFKNISEFPSLPYHLINFNDYAVDAEFGSKAVNLITSYGCPHRCGFCVTNQNQRWTALPAEKIIEEIEMFVKKFGINYVKIQDPNFFVDKERVRKFCNGLIEKKLNIQWGLANGRTDELVNYSEDLWQLMSKSGLASLLIGAESGSQEILDIITKDTIVENTIKVAELCKKYNIIGYYSFVVGFPSDILFKKEIKAFYNLADKLYKIGNCYILLFLYTPYPGTRLYNLSIQKGFKSPNSLEEWAVFDFSVKTTPWITNKQAKLVDQLNTFVFPFKSNIYKGRVSRMKHKYIFNLINFIFHISSSIRWKLKFFRLPLDYYLYKVFLKKKNEK